MAAVNNRSGAPSFVKYIQLACRFSHFPGFRAGLARIMGESNATAMLALWDPFCAWVDIYVASDDWPFQKDATSGEFWDNAPVG